MSTRRRVETEHAGAKNGGGFYGPRADAKRISNVLRRRADRVEGADPPRSALGPCERCGHLSNRHWVGHSAGRSGCEFCRCAAYLGPPRPRDSFYFAPERVTCDACGRTCRVLNRLPPGHWLMLEAPSAEAPDGRFRCRHCHDGVDSSP